MIKWTRILWLAVYMSKYSYASWFGGNVKNDDDDAGDGLFCLFLCLFVLFCRLQIFSNGSVQKRKGDLTGGKRKWLGLPGVAISQNGTGGGEIPQLTIAHRRRLPLIRWTLKITNLKNNKTSILLSLWTSPCHEWNRYKNHLKDSG